MFESTTPRIDDPALESLLEKLDSNLELVILPIEIFPEARENDCFEVVRKKVEHDGGRAILGWQIWKGPHIIEAEFHCVWESPDEQLHDITPKSQHNLTHILFLEDENAIYEGKQVDNVRVNITNNVLVDHLIESLHMHFLLMNQGRLSELHGTEFNLALTPEQRTNIKINEKISGVIYLMLMKDMDQNSTCPCGRQKPYKRCHGKNFVSKIRDRRGRVSLFQKWNSLIV